MATLDRPAEMTTIEGGSATTPKGFLAGAVFAGIKTLGEDPLDLGILASDRPATAAAMFTRSTVKGHGVILSAAHVEDGRARAIVVNSGCANVATGDQGMADAREMAALAAARLGVPETEVLVGSTGVIGRMLPMDRISAGIEQVVLREDGGHDFARAIMTTDTHPKTLAVPFRTSGGDYTVGAVAKGSGMIHPDMATMFCFLTTDAPVEPAFLSDALRRVVDVSLNMVSVDNDTSTSDTVAILANGAGGGPEITAGSPDAPPFEEALGRACTAIARTLARDGEGATKLIEVRVEGAATLDEARAAARTISASPLVKTAMHGNDPNWGRILMAAGRSGARTELSRAHVWLGDTVVYAGAPVDFDEVAASDYLRAEEVLLRLDLGAGTESATAWGCDMSHDYVHINSDYTT